MERRTFAWWRLAEMVGARLASPRTDITEADREVEALFRASWLWRRGDAIVSALHAAWRDSRSRRLIRWTAGR